MVRLYRRYKVLSCLVLAVLCVVTVLSLTVSRSASAQLTAPAPDLLTIDMSSNQVGITTGFSGASFSVFGMNQIEGDVAIIVEGPPRSLVVRRKDNVAGLWMNRQSVRFINIPIYYDLALSTPSLSMAQRPMLEKYHIGLDVLKLEYRGKHDKQSINSFREALVRNKQLQGVFSLEPRKIEFLNKHFFRADFSVPPNVPTGNYRVRAFLFENGVLLDQQEKQLKVAQVGFSATILGFAYNQSFLYAISCILMALIAGLGAYFIMRRG